MKYPVRTTEPIPHALFDRRFLIELRLLHGYPEHLTRTFSDGLDPANECEALEAVSGVHAMAGIACAQLDLALAGGDELAALQACLETAQSCLKAARRCDSNPSLGELGESMRLLGLCSVSLVCTALGEVERQAAKNAAPSARKLPGHRAALLAAV